MKIRNGFILREIADNIIVVPTGDLVNDFNQMITLNNTGKFIWELLQNDIKLEEIAEKLSEKYNIDIEKAKIDSENFVNKLKNAKVIEE